MADMDHAMKDVTIPIFLDTLAAATAQLHTVQPKALREPLRLWFRATAHKAINERWSSLLGRPVVEVWNAARAIFDHQPSTKDSDQ